MDFSFRSRSSFSVPRPCQNLSASAAEKKRRIQPSIDLRVVRVCRLLFAARLSFDLI